MINSIDKIIKTHNINIPKVMSMKVSSTNFVFKEPTTVYSNLCIQIGFP